MTDGAALTDPSQHLFWLGSRSLGIVAMLLVSASVGLGLALSGRLGARPGSSARFKTLHEAIALASLLAIAAHGLLLLGDSYLHPDLSAIAVPFVMDGQPVWTGVGIIGGWLAAVLGLSFYARRWIGNARWRRLHRWTIAVFGLSLAHTIGSGSDARSTWLIALLALATVPIVFTGVYRLLPKARPGPSAVAAGTRRSLVRSQPHRSEPRGRASTQSGLPSAH